MSKGNKTVVKQAIADATALREAAVDAAKQKLVEELSPAIKNLVEKTLNRSINEDQDRLRRAHDGYGETEFEESAKKGDNEMEKDEKDLEKESLGSMFPGLSEMEEEDLEGDVKEAASEEEVEESQIPTLGEGEDEDEEEDKDEDDLELDEAGLRKAYESMMRTADNLKEAQVSSGFKDSAKSTEWETEDSAPSDHGIAGKQKEGNWEEEEPPAAQDHQVQEAIEKGLRENPYLRGYVQHLEEQYANAISVNKKLSTQIKEVNLFNSKVLHVQEMLNKFGKKLTKEQKQLVIKKIDEAKTVREVKMQASTLAESFKMQSANLTESRARKNGSVPASRTVGKGSVNQKVLSESAGQEGQGSQWLRQQYLAGLKR